MISHFPAKAGAKRRQGQSSTRVVTLKGRSGVKVKPRRSVWVARPHRELQNKEPTTLVAQFSMLSLVRQQAQGRQAPSRAPLLVQKRGMRERADKEQLQQKPHRGQARRKKSLRAKASRRGMKLNK